MIALTESALARIAIRLPASGVTGRIKFNGINDRCNLFCDRKRLKAAKSCNCTRDAVPSFRAVALAL